MPIHSRKNCRALKRLLPLALTLSAGLALANCTTSTPATTKGACAVWQPITSSVNDTEQTRVEIIGNNAARKAYCGDP